MPPLAVFQKLLTDRSATPVWRAIPCVACPVTFWARDIAAANGWTSAVNETKREPICAATSVLFWFLLSRHAGFAHADEQFVAHLFGSLFPQGGWVAGEILHALEQSAVPGRLNYSPLTLLDEAFGSGGGEVVKFSWGESDPESRGVKFGKKLAGSF